MTAPVRCAICGCAVVWVPEGWWVHIYDPTVNLDHAPVVPASPEADAARAASEADYVSYRAMIYHQDVDRERAFETWRKGLEL